MAQARRTSKKHHNRKQASPKTPAKSVRPKAAPALALEPEKPAVSLKQLQSETRAETALPALRKWNIILAVLYALQGLAILLFGVNKSYAVTTGYQAVDPLQTAAQAKPVLVTAVHHLFDLPLSGLVAAFLFIAALAHLGYATWWRAQYTREIERGINRWRWAVYALTGGLMMVGIGLLAGMQDISLLLAIFALTAVTFMCNLALEARSVQLGGRLAGSLYWLGNLAGLVPWLAVAVYVFGANLYGGSVPGYMYGIFASILVLSAGLLAVRWLQLRAKGRWAEPLFAEKVYMVLGFATKTALAWQIFAGVLKP